MRNGFTLVELSIVLVIVGLLIGGILVGQSLINSAKNQKFLRNIQQYDIAGMNFKQKFKAPPGDSDKFLPQGNNDGCIKDCNTAAKFNGEYAGFWAHLSRSGILKAQYTEVLPAGELNSDKNNLNAPDFKFDSTALILPLTESYFKYYYVIVPDCGGDASAVGGDYNVNYALTLIDIKAIDNKLDNGDITTGEVIATNNNGTMGALQIKMALNKY